MPGNEVGDRVHNFFAQDNLAEGSHSQVADGNWSLNDNSWAGSRKHFGGSGSNPRSYNLQQSETDRGHGGQCVPVPHNFNFTQTTARPEFAKSQSQSEQLHLNGYMYGRQTFQTRQDEANFLGVDTESGRNNANLRGFPLYESQQESMSEQTPKNLFRSDTSDAHSSFDLFGGQHQMSGQYPGLLQPLQQQQSGFSDIQQLQQQLMFRKMQELQRQEDLRQLEARQQNSVNQASSFARQASGSHSHGLLNGTPTSDSSGNPWAEFAAGNTNWLQRASPVMQGSSSGLAFSPEQGQPQRSMGFAHQQVDQSLYGVPVSSSREPLNQYPRVATDKASIQQLPTYGNHYAVIPEQLTVQDGASVSRQGLPGKNLFGNTSNQGPNSGMKMEHVQQLKAPRNASVQESHAAQDLFGPSEMVQDKSATEVTSSHGQASLDPDEEKILFGSDDNIWDAFGNNRNMGGVSSLFDDNEFVSGLPSIQSGSWSALMQSAVAETSSSGGGLQEEWTDLNFHNSELASGKRPSTYEGSRKQGDINLSNASALSFGSVPIADGANMNDKHHSNMRFQHHGKINSYEHDERLQINYSKQMNQHLAGGTKWLNCEESRLYVNDANSVGEEINAKGISGHYGTNPPDNDRTRIMHNEIGQNPFLHHNVEPEPVKSSLFSPRINRDGFTLSDAAAMPNLSNLQGGNHSSQFPRTNHPVNYWKHVDSSVKSKGSENPSLRRLNKGPQVSESSFNSSDKEDLSSRRENSNDSYRSGSSHLAPTVGANEKFSSDGGDSRSLTGTKQSLSNQAGQKTSGPRKFQYHPMGNMDEDAGICGTRQGINTQAMSLQQSQGLGQEQRNFAHTKISGQGHVPELEGVSKGSNDLLFKGMIPGPASNMFSPHDRSIGLSISDKASQPSKNMLELLHKVDQSRDRGIARHLNSSERNLSSEMPEPENSDGSFGGHQRSQSSNSQGIGLQLGPPSQRAMQTVKSSSLSQAQASPNQRGKGHDELSPFSSFQETSRGEFKNDRIAIEGQNASETSVHKMMANFSAALGTDFSNSRSQLQNHQMIGARGQALTNHSGNESVNRISPHIRQADETCSKQFSGQSLEGSLSIAAGSGQASQSSVGERLPSSQTQGAFPKMLPNAWTNLPAQAQKGQQNFSLPHQLNIVESTSLGRQNLEEQEVEKRGDRLSKFGASSLNSIGFASVGEKSANESPSLNLSSEKVDQAQTTNGPSGNDASSLNSAATQKDLEAFGRSLKPNNFHQHYSLLNQMKAMKNTENDPNNRVLNRLKDSDNFLGGQQVAPWSGQPKEHNNMVGDASTCHTVAGPGDSKMLRFSGPTDNMASLPSKDLVVSDQNESQSCNPGNSTTSGKIEHSHISLQMAPSWFDQYGTFKNDQMLPQRVDTVNTMEQPFSIGRVSCSLETHSSKEQVSAAADMDQAGVIRKNPVPSSQAVEKFSTPSLSTNISVQNLVALRPEKRKRPTADLHPWLKEVLGGFKNLPGICAAAMEWSRATNRLMEKVEDDGEVLEDVLPVPRPKKRFVLTTHLMQQLLPPPPVAILSTDATLNWETMAFYAARLALGDACNLVSSSVPHSGPNFLSVKNRQSDGTDDRLSEIVEDYTSKAKKLEDDFLRLDKRTSILDVRVECEDVERFSVMNRFAKFHGREEDPLRYVIAVPFPKNLPERLHCVSL